MLHLHHTPHPCGIRSFRRSPSERPRGLSVRRAARPGGDELRQMAAEHASDELFPLAIVKDEARRAIEARECGQSQAELSLDLGISVSHADVTADGVTLAHSSEQGGGQSREIALSWSALEEVADDDNGVWRLVSSGTLERVQEFSASTGRAVSLFPSQPRAPPTALVAGFPMHRFGKGVDPRDDTNRKMRALGRLRDGHKVLDICTGLGYTAICASAGGADVTTIELDAAMQRMCRLNPWSAPLFSDDITQLMGDATELVRSMPDETFDRIIHDPPTFALAGELYSREFYTQLNRILTANGKLFHYVGDPDSRAAGKHFQGIIRRLQEAGFEGAATDYDAHGVVASHRARRGTRSRRARKPAARGDGGGGGAVPEGRRRSKHRGNATMLRDTIREAQEEEP